MKNLFLLVFSVLLTTSLFAQTPANRISIQGKVTDTTGAVLPGSNVMLLMTTDSSLVTFGRTNDAGMFSLKNVKRGSYILKISYVGFIPYDKLLDTGDQPNKDLGPLKLKPIAKELFEVVVKTARAPLTIKGDTIEYNAASFKVPPGSTVEDLLRRLPGMQIDQDGNIKAQGEDVKRVTVDGKTFFGSDPKAATKNLSAEAISKVQVFSDKTEQAKLTGVEDGKKEKTLNLQLKDGFKKGSFGKLTAGVGSDLRPNSDGTARTELKGNYNRFDDKRQFSVIGMGNNTNQTGLSFDDYQDFRGSNSFNWNDDADFGFSSGSRFISFGGDDDDNLGIPIGGGSGRGYSNNAAAGINYNYDTKKTKFSSSYYYSQTRQTIDAVRKSQTFLENSSFNRTDSSSQLNFNNSHRVSLRFQQELDSMQTLVILSNSRFSKGNTNLNSWQQLYRLSALSTRTTINNFGNTDAFGTANSVVYRSKFKKKGRNLALSATYQVNLNDAEMNLNSINEFFQATNVNDQLRIIRQLQTTDTKRSQYKISALYLEPLSKKFFWESFYNFSLRNDVVDRDVMDRGESGQETRNNVLSRYYENNYLFNRLGTGLRYSNKGVNLLVGAAGQQFKLAGEYAPDQTAATFNKINRTFTNVIPNVSFNYSMKGNKYLRFSYDVGIQLPSTRDLQPVIDNTNPLYITEGNPDLLPTLRHQLSGGYNMFNPGTFTNLYFSLNYTYNVNQIVYNQIVDPTTLITRTKPANISGGQNVGSYIGFGFPLKKTKANFNIYSNINYGKNLTNINGQLNETNTSSIGIGPRLDLTPNDKITIYANANWNISNTKYSISTGQNQTIYNFFYGGEANVKLPLGFYLNTTLNYRVYKNDRFGFNQHIPIWNSSLYTILGKAKKAEIRFTAYDMLNRNLAVSQSAFTNSVSQERVQTLSRYFLVSFTYNMRGVQAKMKRQNFF
ncbi:TonB-dependent receptor [Arsenicibacter rosenii]|uniref:TonB-dependent receptor n=1 Tax=Arsenicibacter rosenii TaxID=1750698 RepID=A0A1S2VHA5_9BACT|nr:TonB-dependent receptor [Arsenicibacter rosenii]OIN58109.1 TonB-dependent receptor [Arsenicibacter rosenii]